MPKVYFVKRSTSQRLRVPIAHSSSARSRELQERALEILQFKLDVLWALADAIMLQQCEIEIKGPKG